ncbi:MAG: transporter substrate-binding domain-containing protein [Spirulinaceae cyanobacterium]
MWLRTTSLSLLLASAFVALSVSSLSSYAAELEEIERRGKLIVGVKDNLPPLSFQDEQGELAGLEIDIAKGLAAELLGDSEAIIFKPITNLERFQAVLNDEVDIAIARVTFTDSRARVVDFSPYYYLDGTGLITKNSSKGKLTDFTQSTIAVLENSSTIAVIRYHLPQAKLVGVESYQQAWQLLENNQAEAFAGDITILTGWEQEYPQYRQLPLYLSGEPLGIIMPRGLQYSKLRQQVNRTITGWHNSGWLRQRATYWGLP